jgi:hypothetical protein
VYHLAPRSLDYFASTDLASRFLSQSTTTSQSLEDEEQQFLFLRLQNSRDHGYSQAPRSCEEAGTCQVGVLDNLSLTFLTLLLVLGVRLFSSKQVTASDTSPSTKTFFATVPGFSSSASRRRAKKWRANAPSATKTSIQARRT